MKLKAPLGVCPVLQQVLVVVELLRLTDVLPEDLVDSNFVGESFTQVRPTDVNRRSAGDYALTNLRLGLQNSSGGWDTYLFANNLFNRVGVLTVSTGGTTGGIDLVNSTMPRTIGLEFRKKF
jgi:iron complex outermembrane recepter protein